MLSSGAGTEVQLGMAGFYKDEAKCYHRVEDIADIESFARTFYEAAIKDKEASLSSCLLPDPPEVCNQWLFDKKINNEWRYGDVLIASSQ